jgi:hypothetical protein
MDYNGWSNRATWNVSLWLNSDEGVYRELQRAIRRATDVEDLAETLEKLCADLWQDGKTPDGDLLSECDWSELAASEWDDDNQTVAEPEPESESPNPLQQIIEQGGIAFERSWVPSRPDGMMESPHMTRHFKCKIGHARRSMTLYFSQGSAHTEPPTLADVLDCLASDASTYENSGSFENWAGELGFDTDSRKAEKIYRITERQTKQLKRVLGDELFKQLLEAERM